MATTRAANSVLQTPFKDLLPPLSSEEFEALQADIKANGVRHAIFVDEDGNILDGHHRHSINPDCERIVVYGLSAAEKEAFVYRANFVRRNLSPSQKQEARAKMKATAKRLREEDVKKWTQKRIAQTLGVARETVRDWFPQDSRTNGESANASKPSPPKPDARVKVDPKAKPVIAERVTAGEPQAQVAADYGVSQRTVSTIVKAEAKQAEVKAKREESAKQRTTNCGVIHGDFRVFGQGLDDDSVDLIFTDPPYDEESVDLYGSLAELAERVLVPGGWLLAYGGKSHIPQTLDAMSSFGLFYGWTFCVLHSGGDARFRKFKLQTGWKPVFGFYKPPLQVGWDWFKDVVTGGKEKSDHPWQQAEEEARHFIQRLSPLGGIVCDPFCGSGTTLAAAKSIGRRWIGCEINEQHVETARSRVDDTNV